MVSRRCGWGKARAYDRPRRHAWDHNWERTDKTREVLAADDVFRGRARRGVTG